MAKKEKLSRGVVKHCAIEVGGMFVFTVTENAKDSLNNPEGGNRKRRMPFMAAKASWICKAFLSNPAKVIEMLGTVAGEKLDADEVQALAALIQKLK
jgi:hypothetical protein